MPELTPADLELLRRLAGRMLPAAPAYDAPGADDPAIFDEVAAALQPAPASLADLIADLAGGAQAELDALRPRHPAAMAAVIAAVAQAYYRDDRVMRSLGMEPRPPFPQGYQISQGDWTLLDPVRARPPAWRPAG